MAQFFQRPNYQIYYKYLVKLHKNIFFALKKAPLRHIIYTICTNGIPYLVSLLQTLYTLKTYEFFVETNFVIYAQSKTQNEKNILLYEKLYINNAEY